MPFGPGTARAHPGNPPKVRYLIHTNCLDALRSIGTGEWVQPLRLGDLDRFSLGPHGTICRMASFIFIYRAGPDPVPADRVAENRAAWQAWNTALNEDYGIRTASGKLVTPASVSDYVGDVRGASMVEFESMDAAVEVALKSPNLAFGGSVEVLSER